MLRKNCNLPAAPDFRRPISLLGSALNEPEKESLRVLVKTSENLFKVYPVAYSSPTLVELLEYVERCTDIGPPFSENVLANYVRFLRLTLMSSSEARASTATVLIDVLVKNSGSAIHKLVGKRYFMKTISLAARRNFSNRRTNKRDLGIFMLDCIQGWGEAFSTLELRQVYPNFYDQYFKLRTKYGMPFGLPYDPRRVPVFLGPMSKNPGNDQRLIPLTSTVYDFDSTKPDSPVVDTFEILSCGDYEDLLYFSPTNKTSNINDDDDNAEWFKSVGTSDSSMNSRDSSLKNFGEENNEGHTDCFNPITELMAPSVVLSQDHADEDRNSMCKPPPPPPRQRICGDPNLFEFDWMKVLKMDEIAVTRPKYDTTCVGHVEQSSCFKNLPGRSSVDYKNCRHEFDDSMTSSRETASKKVHSEAKLGASSNNVTVQYYGSQRIVLR